MGTDNIQRESIKTPVRSMTEFFSNNFYLSTPPTNKEGDFKPTFEKQISEKNNQEILVPDMKMEKHNPLDQSREIDRAMNTKQENKSEDTRLIEQQENLEDDFLDNLYMEIQKSKEEEIFYDNSLEIPKSKGKTFKATKKKYGESQVKENRKMKRKNLIKSLS